MQLILGFLLAMSVTILLIPPLIQSAERWRFVDLPGGRKVHATPVPRVGGIAMAAGMLLALALSGEFAQPMPAYLAGLCVLVGFGVWDDRATLTPGVKLIGQIIAVLTVMIWGDVTISTMTLAERFDLPQWVAYPLTLFFLLGVTNAINLADGLDGLAGGTTLLSLSALALLAFTSGAPFVGAAAIVIVGAILGFLRFNTHPARVFMGDGGSQMLGFSAAVLAVVLTQNEATPLSSALPLLLLGIPIIDTLMVMTQRVLEGRSPFHADRNHIHHRLLSLGFDHHEAVMAIYVLQGCLFVTAWFLRYQSDLTIVGVFAGVCAAAVGTLHLAANLGWKWRVPVPGAAPAKSKLALAFHWLGRAEHLPRWALMAIAGVLGAYFLAVALACPSPSGDVRLMAGLLGVGLAGIMLLRWRAVEASMLDKAALYVSVAMAVYFDRQVATALENTNFLQLAAFGTLVAGILVRFRLASDRRFRITPLDVITLFMTIVLPNLPGSVIAQSNLGESVAKLIALMYGIETLLGAAARWWRIPSLTAMIFLATCALHGAV